MRAKRATVFEMTATISTILGLWQSRLHLWQVLDLYLSTKPFPGRKGFSANFASASESFICPSQQHPLVTDLANVAAHDISPSCQCLGTLIHSEGHCTLLCFPYLSIDSLVN